MQFDVYERHIKNFSNHWWFQAREKIIENLISKNFKKKINILDFGSGSGVNVKMLSKYGFVNMYEPHLRTRKYLKFKYKNKKKFRVLNKVNKENFDLIVLADVLEHLKNDKKELKNLTKKLKKNGYILITVPAFNFLFSSKDTVLGHYRRYDKKQIMNLFKKFKVKKLSYFNFFLFVPISLIVIFSKLFNISFINKAESTPNPFINKILFNIFLIEKVLLNVIYFPFGVSLLGLFKKND